MARRPASLALATLIVLARLASGAGTAIATNSADAAIRPAQATQPTPTRSLRTLVGVPERHLARSSSLGAWLATDAFAFGEPLRVIAPPTLLSPPALVASLAPPRAGARAPPITALVTR